jgi:hypothetical protein
MTHANFPALESETRPVDKAEPVIYQSRDADPKTAYSTVTAEPRSRPRVDFAQWLAELQGHPEFLLELLAVMERAKVAEPFVPLALETRPTITTAALAHYTHSTPQTWRIHSMRQTGGVKSIRINGKLHWPTEQVRKLLGVTQ